MNRRFVQVDVFGSRPLGGNPLAVVVDGEGLSADAMQEFARWTGLSETTFLLAPTAAEADYRVRIFTPGEELPFAGHPTLGSAYAWLQHGGATRDGLVVQECGVGLVRVRVESEGHQLSFEAPPLRRSGPLSESDLADCLDCFGIGADRVVDHAWGDNGPPWAMVLLDSPETLRAIRPAPPTRRTLFPAAVALTPDEPWAYEVRAFVPPPNPIEDPVTGSLNAAAARWLRSLGLVPASYSVRQGMQVGASGEVSITDDGEHLWVGGVVRTVIAGSVDLG